MDDEVSFAPDLYRGTAGYYDRFRLSYPDVMTADLMGRVAPSGQGRLLDLACGTGQLAFPLAPWYSEVWAVDQEPDMIDMVRAKMTAGAVGRILPVAASAEEFQAGPESFELIVVGNAFHRLNRGLTARRTYGWLQPGRCLALCWSFSPWTGPQEWQRAFDALLQRWKAALGATGRIPSRWDKARRELPDAELLLENGFELVGRYEFAVEQQWTLSELAGLIRSTSFLPPSVLATHGDTFDAELAATLGPYTVGGLLADTVSFAYELARRPALSPQNRRLTSVIAAWRAGARAAAWNNPGYAEDLGIARGHPAPHAQPRRAVARREAAEDPGSADARRAQAGRQASTAAGSR
jgi:SAM-dependent methyltransferase